MKVKAIPFSGANTVKIEDNLVVICDCNLVKTAKPEELKALLHLKVNLSERGGLLVIAALALLEVLTLTALHKVQWSGISSLEWKKCLQVGLMTPKQKNLL